MSRETFNTFWHGRSLSALEVACMRSFIDQGHRLRVFTYDDLALPAGVEAADAGDILPRDRLFTFRGSPSAFTNIFRYKLLYRDGGWWVDTDVLCRKAQLPACDYYWAEQHPGQLNGAIMKFPPSDELCQRLLDLSQQRAGGLKRWGELGPMLLSEVLQDFHPAGHAGSTEDAYAVHWLETHFFWLPEFAPAVQRRTSGATFVHFWHSLFTGMGLDVNRQPPKGSFLDSVYASYDVSALQPTDDSADRDAIIRFLQQEWVTNAWCHRLGRDMDDLGVATMQARKAQRLSDA